ncbi:hypothetical protein GQ53DRAFT_740786 [Thozetella sp. PMI_491]|nr:hypothetical protein GQ53DRAFT_740786 [Thozetella sp. PMI_491]
MLSSPSASTLSVALLLAATFRGAEAQGCAANNCLRGLRSPAVITSARSFCSQYTVGAWPSPLPTYAAACNGALNSISSACSCIATTAGSSSTTTATTTATDSSAVSSSSSGVPSCPTLSPVSTVTVTSCLASTSTYSPVSCTTTPPTTITVTSTIAGDSGTPTVPGPPGSTNIFNPVFEFPVEDNWCKGADPTVCRRVNVSSDGKFGGLFGPYMLQAFTTFDRGPGSLPVPVIRFPNPANRNWIFRWAARTTGSSCHLTLILIAEDGYYTPTYLNIPSTTWGSYSWEIPLSAGGIADATGMRFFSDCSDGKMYVDGVGVL